MMYKYIDALSDFGFKHLFGKEKHKPFLIAMLNALVFKGNMRIVDLEYRKTVFVGRSKKDRSAVIDIICVTESGLRIIVEMQKRKQEFFMDRALFYASCLIQENAKPGDWDFELPPIYIISFLKFQLTEQPSQKVVTRTVRLKDENCEESY